MTGPPGRGKTDALRGAGGLSWFWFRRGHVPEGRFWLDRVIHAADEGDHRGLPRVLLGRASIQYLEGDLPGAGASLQRAIRMAESLGETRTRARARGDLDRAETLLLEGAAGAREIGHHWQASSASWVAAKVALDRGDPDTAAQRAGLCIRLMWAEGDRTSTLVGLHTMAVAVAMQGEPERAARLLGAVAAAGERIGYFPERMDPLDAGRHMARVRERITKGGFDRAYQEGRALTLDAAVVLALTATAAERFGRGSQEASHATRFELNEAFSLPAVLLRPARTA